MLLLLLPPLISPKLQTLTLTLTKSRTRSRTLTLALSSSSYPQSHPLLQIKPFITPQWRPILLGWLSSAASVSLLSASLPRLSRLPHQPPSKMANELVILAALACARSISIYLQHAFLWEAALGSACAIREHVFGRVVERDLGFFEGSDGVPYGDIAHRITGEASDVADTLYAIFNTIVPNFLQLSAMAAQMITVSPVLSLMSALVIPCMSLIVAYLGERLRKISRKAQLSSARLSAYLNEVLPSMLVVKANNGELNESLRFQRLAHNDLVQKLKKRKMKALIPQIVQVMCIGGLVVLCAGSFIVSRDSFDLSSLLSFIMSLALLVQPLQDAGKAYNELKEGEPAIERLLDLTRFNSKVIENPDAVDLACLMGDIKFCGVSFRYGASKPLVLNGLDLHIKSGERVAFIGPSGGGKTTLTKLLLRLYEPLYGRILVDDHDIKDIRLRCLRDHIVLVPQDMNLFSGTVAENIGYRDSIGKFNMEQVENAARIANAEEFIKSLPEGYNTNIGQRGSLLSGGQKQRLAIARALYHKSSILILDEATSALDSRSEQLVRHALEHLMSDRTVLVIAHRLETVLMADRVFLVDGGKLKEVEKSSLLSQYGQYTLSGSSELII